MQELLAEALSLQIELRAALTAREEAQRVGNPPDVAACVDRVITLRAADWQLRERVRRWFPWVEVDPLWALIGALLTENAAEQELTLALKIAVALMCDGQLSSELEASGAKLLERHFCRDRRGRWTLLG